MFLNNYFSYDCGANPTLFDDLYESEMHLVTNFDRRRLKYLGNFLTVKQRKHFSIKVLLAKKPLH